MLSCLFICNVRPYDINSNIWTDALFRSGDDELVENLSFAISQRGEGWPHREADTEGLNEQAQRQRYPS